MSFTASINPSGRADSAVVAAASAWLDRPRPMPLDLPEYVA